MSEVAEIFDTFFNGRPAKGSAPTLTKRELFAAMAMQGFCSRKFEQGEPPADTIAAWAVDQANALLKALERGGSGNHEPRGET